MRLIRLFFISTFILSIITSCALIDTAKEKMGLTESKTTESKEEEKKVAPKKVVEKVAPKKSTGSGYKPYVKIDAKKVISSGETYLARIFVKRFNKKTGRTPKLFVNGLQCVYDGTGNFGYFTIQSPNPGQKNWKGYAKVPVTSSRDTTINFSLRYEVR